MSIKFTDATIRNLKPAGRRYDVREGDGFAVRVSPNGGKTFVFFYHHQGQKFRLTLGQYPAMPLKDARAAFVNARHLLQNGVNPAAEKATKRTEAIRQREEAARLWTLEALANAYIKHHAKPKKRTWEEDQRMLSHDVLPYWGKLKAEEIGVREVNRLLDRIKERGSPIQANRVYSLLHKLFNFAIQRGELTINPCIPVAKPAPERVKERALTYDEIKIFWNALKYDGMKSQEHIRLALRLQLLTGCRIGEVLNAQWEELDPATGWLEIPIGRMKNIRPHRVWLGSEQARLILARLEEIRDGSPWVFPSPKNIAKIITQGHKMSETRPLTISAVNTAIQRSRKSLGLEHFTSHDLRRTAATRMAEIGIQPHIIGKALSHVDSSVTAVHYIKYSYDQEKEKALAAWATRLIAIAEGQEPAAVIQFPGYQQA